MKQNKKSNFWVQVILGLVVVVGVGGTIWDYRQWRRLERQNYGQGWGDLQLAAAPLTTEVKDASLEIEMKLPQGWQPGKQVILSQGKAEDLGVKKWVEEESGGRAFVRERRGKKIGDRVIVMEVRVGEEEWGKWEKTIQAIFESIRQVD